MGQQSETQQQDHKSYYRWIVLGSFCLNTMINLFPFTGLFPIWTQALIYYNIDSYNLNWLTNCYYFGPSIFAFIFNPIILYNFGISQIISNICSVIGLWILALGGQNFQIGLLGYSFLGLGISFLAHVPLHVSQMWFDTPERILSTFIGQYSNNIGMLIGYLISAFYLNNISQEEFNIRFQMLFTIYAIIGCISIIFNISTLKKPKKECQIELRHSYWFSIKVLMQSTESRADILSVSSFIGLSWCYPLFLEIQQYNEGQTLDDVITVSIAFMIGQIFAAFLCTIKLLHQSHLGFQITYDKYIKIILSIGFFFLTLEFMMLESLSMELLTTFNIFIGAGLGGIWSIMLESLTEKYYPNQELAIGYSLCSCANIVAVIITMILQLPDLINYGFQIACCLMILPFSYAIIGYQTIYRRFEQES